MQCSSFHNFSRRQSRRGSKVKWTFKSQDTESISDLILLTAQMWAAYATSRTRVSVSSPATRMIISTPQDYCNSLKSQRFWIASHNAWYKEDVQEGLIPLSPWALPLCENLKRKKTYPLKLRPPKYLFRYSCIWLFLVCNKLIFCFVLF